MNMVEDQGGREKPCEEPNQMPFQEGKEKARDDLFQLCVIECEEVRMPICALRETKKQLQRVLSPLTKRHIRHLSTEDSLPEGELHKLDNHQEHQGVVLHKLDNHQDQEVVHHKRDNHQDQEEGLHKLDNHQEEGVVSRKRDNHQEEEEDKFPEREGDKLLAEEGDMRLVQELVG